MFLLLALSVTSQAADAPPRPFPEYRRPVMTWVPPYAVEVCRARLEASFDGWGMKDGLTHLGLQFWVPDPEGGLKRIGGEEETGDAQVAALRTWAHRHGIRVLLCVYNGQHGWDWALAREAMSRTDTPLVEALLQEVRRLKLDGVDVDLEGTGSLDADRELYLTFIRQLSERLRAESWHLTVDTFAYRWHAPNQTWWSDLLPLVDGLTSMGYEEIGADAPDWRSYDRQKQAAGKWAGKLMIGLPSGRDAWQDREAREHLQWLWEDGDVGVSFWDAQLKGLTWRKPETWRLLRDIRGRPEER